MTHRFTGHLFSNIFENCRINGNILALMLSCVFSGRSRLYFLDGNLLFFQSVRSNYFSLTNNDFVIFIFFLFIFLFFFLLLLRTLHSFSHSFESKPKITFILFVHQHFPWLFFIILSSFSLLIFSGFLR